MTIDKLFMTSLKIDLQQLHIDVKIFSTKIDVHIVQAKLINALSHYYRDTRLNSHEICAQTYTIKLFEFFTFYVVLDFFTHIKLKPKSKIKNKSNAYKEMQDAQNA